MKKPFYEFIKDFIYGVDEEELEELNLNRNAYRPLTGLYMIKKVDIPKKEISKIKTMLEKMTSDKTFGYEVRNYAQKVLDSFDEE
jgi:hypothetical protein